MISVSQWLPFYYDCRTGKSRWFSYPLCARGNVCLSSPEFSLHCETGPLIVLHCCRLSFGDEMGQSQGIFAMNDCNCVWLAMFCCRKRCACDPNMFPVKPSRWFLRCSWKFPISTHSHLPNSSQEQSKGLSVAAVGLTYTLWRFVQTQGISQSNCGAHL